MKALISELDTLFLNGQGKFQKVGRFQCPSNGGTNGSNGHHASTADASNDGVKERHSPLRPSVLISHAGGDSVNEELARPTDWFLTQMGVESFLEDSSFESSEEMEEATCAALYQCTHAVIFFSPEFLRRKWCVQELNTLMYRRHGGGVHLLPILWKLDNIDGYNPRLQEIKALRPKTKSPVYALLDTIWPALVEVLGFPPRSHSVLKEQFIAYCCHEAGSGRAVPFDFTLFIQDHGVALGPTTPGSHPTGFTAWKVDGRNSEPSTDSSLPNLKIATLDDGATRFAVSFSAIYKDDDHDWNEKVLEHKPQLEENLNRMANLGTVVYGSVVVHKQCTGWLGLGAPSALLECEIEYSKKLSDSEKGQATRAALAVARLLREAGTTEKELDQILVGAIWKG